MQNHKIRLLFFDAIIAFLKRKGGTNVRFLVLVLSMSAVVFFGYAVAGLAGFLLGRGRSDYIIFGLLLGFASTAASLLLWRHWLSLLEKEALHTADNTGEKLS